MENSHPFLIQVIFLILYGCFERLNLELFGPGGRNLDIIIFVEKQWNVVVITSFHLFPSILLYDALLFRVEVDAITEKVLKIFVLSEDQKIDTEDTYD